MTNREIAAILAKIADLLQIKDDNPFKIRAYRNAARSIHHLDEDINFLHETDRIGEIPGVGKAVKSKIEELLEKGSLDYYERLSAEIPLTLLEILKIPGVGHKTVQLIYRELKIDNIDDLLKAAQARHLRKLPGLGAKTEEKIIAGIELVKKRSGKVTLGSALPLAEEFRDYIKAIDGVKDVSVVGSIRRGKPLVGDIDILVSANDYEKVTRKIIAYKRIKKISGQDEKHIKGQLASQVDFEVIIVNPDEYAYSLVLTTGAQKYRQDLFKDVGIAEFAGLKSEKEVFGKLGLAYIPPQLRENQGEIEKAKRGELPSLVEVEDLRGDLHVHSDWSDGINKIPDIVEMAKIMNYSYIAITDHSKALPISRGLNEERVLAQCKVIDELNKNQKEFKILKGIEVDILKDGDLDLSDEVLKTLDVVVASVHSNFHIPASEQTERIIKAIENEHVDIIGHLTGRLLNRRNAYELDIEKILAAAANNKIALEINSHPDRLDIDGVVAKRAKEYGIKIAINSDAHRQQNLRLVKYGVLTAKRGWLEPEDVINTWEMDKLLDYLKK